MRRIENSKRCRGLHPGVLVCAVWALRLFSVRPSYASEQIIGAFDAA